MRALTSTSCVKHAGTKIAAILQLHSSTHHQFIAIRQRPKLTLTNSHQPHLHDPHGRLSTAQQHDACSGVPGCTRSLDIGPDEVWHHATLLEAGVIRHDSISVRERNVGGALGGRWAPRGQQLRLDGLAAQVLHQLRGKPAQRASSLRDGQPRRSAIRAMQQLKPSPHRSSVPPWPSWPVPPLPQLKTWPLAVTATLCRQPHARVLTGPTSSGSATDVGKLLSSVEPMPSCPNCRQRARISHTSGSGREARLFEQS